MLSAMGAKLSINERELLKHSAKRFGFESKFAAHRSMVRAAASVRHSRLLNPLMLEPRRKKHG
jgi:hypothetical protein